MQELIKDPDIAFDVPVKPRKFNRGRLRWSPGCNSLTKCATLSVSIPATMDTLENLVLVTGGKPMIGLVLGLSNVFFACRPWTHEGEGSSLVYF
ncbi:hypothetical protein M8C21_024440 [Ambrosia artemisiifolia]|uniref:Uncharacterized protein n=1 Tax=Ambrosia artemisiifolia TaxID=4212 RepID=A0AAD5CF83_AMBAR|nr:hypothetical protein M8C21_024440 [Ambrosia artemisiifolia]